MTISPNTRSGYVIVGPYNNVWRDDIFETPQAAAEYLRTFWKDRGLDPARWRIAVGTKTVSVDTVTSVAPVGITTLVDLKP